MMQLLDGRVAAEGLLEGLRVSVQSLEASVRRPGVAFVLVGEDGPSATYVARKQAAAAKIGFLSRVHRVPSCASEAVLLSLIDELNQDPLIDGFLVQAPLPPGYSTFKTFNAIAPHKDVDGFHTQNLGRLCQGDLSGLLPCTPLGIGALLKYYGIPTEGRHVVILGRSITVGRPAAMLFLEKVWNATVTLCHSGTQNLEALTQLADILIVATGRPEWVNEAHVRPGAVVIDVGINRIADSTAKLGYRLVGDVARSRIEDVASALSPVPGGVGPLTVAQLMCNTYKAFCWRC